MNEELIVNTALSNLENATGIKGNWKKIDNQHLTEEWINGNIDFTFRGEKVMAFVEVKRELRNYQLPQIYRQAQRYQPMMVVADHIFPTLKEELRKNDIGYLDTAGNIYLKTANNLIWLDGRPKTKETKQKTNRAFTKTGLKTVFLFLIDETAINLPHRILADMTGVALGNIKNVIEGLKNTGFIMQIDTKTLAIRNKKALLDRWITGYGEILKPALTLGTFRFADKNMEVTWRQLPIERNATAWGGEPAAEAYTGYLRPEIFTIYTYEQKLDLLKRWKLIPDEKGNIKIYQKFWGADLMHDNEGLPVVHPLLVYADLVLTNDPRCIETAERIYNTYLKNGIEKY